MKTSQAVALRVKELLAQKQISQYRLEQDSALSHYTLRAIMKGRTDGINLKTIIALSYGFGVTLSEFFDSPLFDYNAVDFFE